MITIIFAPPRTGKTCFLTHTACMTAFDRQRNRAMQNEIASKIANGFDGIRTIPTHCVAANYDITMYRPRLSRRINPFRLGFANPYVQTHFNIPFEAIFIQEAQCYLNSRMSASFPDWQSRWYEQHGHNKLDIWLDTQRPMLIDINIRELSQFIEIVELEKRYDKFGRLCRLIYMASGKQDKSCYTADTVIADYNVFNCYDSQSCKPKFYDGHFDSDFDYEQARPTDETQNGYKRFLQEFGDELPPKYYARRR